MVRRGCNIFCKKLQVLFWRNYAKMGPANSLYASVQHMKHSKTMKDWIDLINYAKKFN